MHGATAETDAQSSYSKVAAWGSELFFSELGAPAASIPVRFINSHVDKPHLGFVLLQFSQTMIYIFDNC